MKHRGTSSIFTAAQWKWVADRFLEGYSKMDLADFLGVHYTTVLGHVHGVSRPKLPPLSDRKDEFNRLGGR